MGMELQRQSLPLRCQVLKPAERSCWQQWVPQETQQGLHLGQVVLRWVVQMVDQHQQGSQQQQQQQAQLQRQMAQLWEMLVVSQHQHQQLQQLLPLQLEMRRS
jgi:hypothetical protein